MYKDSRFSEHLNRILQIAEREAMSRNLYQITVELLLLTIINDAQNKAFEILKEAGVDIPRVRKELEDYIEKERGFGYQSFQKRGNIQFDSKTMEAFDIAKREMIQRSGTVMGTEHLLLGIIQVENSFASELLMEYSLDITRARNIMLTLYESERKSRKKIG